MADRQFIVFIDPKGIRNIGFNDPKIQFFQTIKDIERRLGDPSVTLSSFIISNTPSHVRSEEHTSELQSLMRISYAVFCLKKKTTTNTTKNTTNNNKQNEIKQNVRFIARAKHQKLG